MTDQQVPKCFDPYDLWMTKLGVYAKRHFYAGHLIGKLLSVMIGVVDWLLPSISRKVLGSYQRLYPITVAQWILSLPNLDKPQELLDLLLSTAVPKERGFGLAWGLGFPWMSKNGLYDEGMPFVTHSPYAMEALLRLSQVEDSRVAELAKTQFNDTWQFLNHLKVMHEDADSLALSYAPVDEPRIVVNANAYACYSFALHAVYGTADSAVCRDKCRQLVTWILRQQNNDGSWYYYADREPGNFIDGFHTCFVLKNLIKTVRLLPELALVVEAPIKLGERYLQAHFIDAKTGLLKRFSERDIKDPFTWDLYDQAEYFGLLVNQNKIQAAEEFLNIIRQHFFKKQSWYARRDFFGRFWGKDFYRWGIMPLQHYLHEFEAQKD